eukprot:72015-Prymnesium_polylepis.1
MRLRAHARKSSVRATAHARGAAPRSKRAPLQLEQLARGVAGAQPSHAALWALLSNRGRQA